MDSGVIINFCAAGFAGVLALGSVMRAGRSVARWSFVVGLAGLAAETAFAGLARDAVLLEEKSFWAKWVLGAGCALTPAWLLFSVSYARGNHRKSIGKWLP